MIGEVHRPAAASRATSAPRRWRPGITCAGSRGRPGRSCTGPRDPARDQSWFLFATTADAARLHPVPARRHAGQGGGAGGGGAARLGGRGQAGQPGSVLRARRPLRRHRWPGCARTRRCPARSSSRDGRVLGHHAGVAGYTVGQGRKLGGASQDGGVQQAVLRVDASRRRIVVGPRQAGRTELRLRGVNWLVQPAAVALHGQAAGARGAAGGLGPARGRWCRGGPGGRDAGGAGAGLRLLRGRPPARRRVREAARQRLTRRRECGISPRPMAA